MAVYESKCLSNYSLVRSLHSLPYITHEFFFLTVTNPDGVEVPFTTLNTDTIFRAWFWGAFIVILTIAVLLLTCGFYCCAGCVCLSRRKSRSQEGTLKTAKVGCAIFSAALIVLAIVVLCVSFWLETRFDNGITSFQAFHQNSSTTTDVTGDTFHLLEFYRFRAALSILSVIMGVLCLSVVAFLTAPLCKSPAAVIVFMVIFILITLLMSAYAGATLIGIVYISDACADLFNLLGNSFCEGSNPLLGALDDLCGNTVDYGFALVILGCGVILILVVLQVLGTVYSDLIVRSQPHLDVVEQKSFSNPIGYGGQTVIAMQNVNSINQPMPPAYSTGPYPVGPVTMMPPATGMPPPSTHSGPGEYKYTQLSAEDTTPLSSPTDIKC